MRFSTGHKPINFTKARERSSTMVFSSLLVYQDPPNWQQLPNQQPGGGCTENPQLPPPPPTVGGGGTGSVRPGSVADRSRLAKLPPHLDQVALKCPRCESSNTKFCYFNNYSLSQPRHFCKTCRRYWTRGGALRNVPVGGGCRRNKKSKGSSTSRSKSPVSTAEVHQATGSSSTSAVSSNTLPPPQLPFLPSLHHLSNYVSGDIGLNFAGIQPPVAATGGGADMEFQIDEQWRQLQQFPFLAGLEPPAGMFQFEGEGVEPPGYVAAQLGSKPLDFGVTQVANTLMKLEENQGLNLSRNFLGIHGNDHYWGGNAWTHDLN